MIVRYLTLLHSYCKTLHSVIARHGIAHEIQHRIVTDVADSLFVGSFATYLPTYLPTILPIYLVPAKPSRGGPRTAVVRQQDQQCKAGMYTVDISFLPPSIHPYDISALMFWLVLA